MRILKKRIDTKYLFAFCKEKKKVYSTYQKFSESSRTPAAPGPSKQEHVTPLRNLIDSQADTGLK